MRDLSALIAQSSQATLFEALEEYPGWQLAGALVSTRKRLALAMGASEDEIAMRFEQGLDRPVEAVMVEEALLYLTNPPATPRL